MPRTFCDSVCKLLSSEYYQITAVRIQDPLKAHVKHALYRSEFNALLKILIASRGLHYEIKRSLKTKFVYRLLIKFVYRLHIKIAYFSLDRLIIKDRPNGLGAMASYPSTSG